MLKMFPIAPTGSAVRRSTSPAAHWCMRDHQIAVVSPTSVTQSAVDDDIRGILNQTDCSWDHLATSAAQRVSKRHFPPNVSARWICSVRCT